MSSIPYHERIRLYRNDHESTKPYVRGLEEKPSGEENILPLPTGGEILKQVENGIKAGEIVLPMQRQPDYTDKFAKAFLQASNMYGARDRVNEGLKFAVLDQRDVLVDLILEELYKTHLQAPGAKGEYKRLAGLPEGFCDADVAADNFFKELGLPSNRNQVRMELQETARTFVKNNYPQHFKPGISGPGQ